MIAFLIARGLSPLVSKLIAYVGIPLLAILFIWWRVHAYGVHRYDAGVNATDAKWVEAGNRLEAAAANSATRADDAAANRLEEFHNQVEDERQALDEANRTGTSPLDVLFGG